MAAVKCEYCGYDQDTDTSKICDNCGRRVGRTRLDFQAPQEVKTAETESFRCPQCSIPTAKPICPNCGAVIRKRSL